MPLRPDQLHSHLQGRLSRLYLLHGDEPLLILEAADAIRKAARVQGYEEREVLIAGPGFRWDQLNQAAGNLSLFGANKLIDLRIPNGKPGREGADALQRHAATPMEGVLTLITLPQLDWQAKKTAWYNALSQAGVAIELNAPGLHELPRWIAQRLQIQQQTAEAAALECLAALVEGNLLAAHQEIQKLALLYPPGQLSLEQIEVAVLDVARFDIDKLRAALLAGDALRCARLLHGLQAEGSAPPLILWALTQEIRTLAQLRSQLDQGLRFDAACSNVRLFGPRQNSYRNAIERFRRPQLYQALQHAARIDRMIKGLTRGDQWDELLQLSLRLTHSGPSRPARPSARPTQVTPVTH